MKTKLLSLLIAFLMLMVFVPACNDTEQTDVTPPVTAQATPDNTPTEAPTAEPTPDVTPAPMLITDVGIEGVPEFSFTEVLRINVGTDYGSIAYEEGFGPMDFLVLEDGSICILDSVNNRILVYKDGVCIDSILITENSTSMLGQVFDYYDGKFYVCNRWTDFIFIIDYPVAENRHDEVITLPEGILGQTVYQLSVDAEGIRISTDEWDETNTFTYDYIKPHNESSFTIKVQSKYPIYDGDNIYYRHGSSFWCIQGKQNQCFKILGADDSGILYSLYYEEDGVGPYYNESICAFDKDGKMIGFVYRNCEKWMTFPQISEIVALDGTIYVMHCLENYVSIQTVNFG